MPAIIWPNIAPISVLGILRCQTLGSIVTTTVTQLFAKPSSFAGKKPQVALFDGFMICTYIFNAYPLAIPWTLQCIGLVKKWNP